MSDRYDKMSETELYAEIDAWLSVVDTPKGPGSPSNAARQAAEHQAALAEAWLHRLYIRKDD